MSTILVIRMESEHRTAEMRVSTDGFAQDAICAFAEFLMGFGYHRDSVVGALEDELKDMREGL